MTVLAKFLQQGTFRKTALLSLALAVVYIVKKWRRSPRKVRWVPGLPVLGSLLDVLRGNREFTIMELYVQWTETFGKTFAYSVPGKTIVATVDPKNIEHVLKTNFNNYIKGEVFADPFTDLLGQGIFNADGEIWHSQRKTASRMFTKKQFETHIWRVLVKNTAKVGELLDRSGGEMLDMFNLMNRFTLDTIGEIGFSKDVGSMDNPTSPFLKSFDLVQQILIKRFWINPYWKFLRVLGLGWEPLLAKHLRLLDEYARDIVRDLRGKAESGEDNSFVGLFMRDSLGAREYNASMEDFMRDMVLNFLIAGRDTTAQALSWTFFEVAQRPHIAAKIRQEVDDVCGDRPVTYDDLKQLRYVQAVMDEGLRLHPSVPMDGKITVNDDTLPDGTVVPAGCVVQYIPYAQGRCREIWGADALEYRPERWLEMPSKPSSFVFSAFNAGPRECLGRRLAEMEMAVLFASVVRDFDFALDCEAGEVRYDVQLTLGMQGLPMRFRRVRTAGC